MKKILTIILDGFGIREDKHGNAIANANMTNFNNFWNTYPHSLLEASEEFVGLKFGQFGNSEVGHMTIGAGRRVLQNELRLDELFKDLKSNDRFKELVKTSQNKKIHIMGLASDGGVHGNIDYFLSLLTALKENDCSNIYFHLITDGRDTSPTSAMKYINMIDKKTKELGVGSISTICGRYFAMDRDKKWDRTNKYYDLVTKGIGAKTTDIKKAIDTCYNHNVTDEFLPPILINSNGLIDSGDVLIWMNYRTDRAKQIIGCFSDTFSLSFNQNAPKIDIYSLVPIDDNIKTTSFLDEIKVENPLGLYLSKLGLTQARVAETEKYAHVTYFFDGGYNGEIEGCDKYLVPSPKVATYDLKPEMSAVGVTKKILECMEHDYDFILVNFANPDMVGHTGNYEAATKACKAVDICLGKIFEEADNNFYNIVLLADHGNADYMLTDNNKIVTTHSLSKVPFIINDKKLVLENGDLTNVAPTILEYMDIAIPKEMKNTKSLIYKDE